MFPFNESANRYVRGSINRENEKTIVGVPKALLLLTLLVFAHASVSLNLPSNADCKKSPVQQIFPAAIFCPVFGV
jgi:hypothetical protein